MAIRRLPGPLRAVPLQTGDHTLYEVELSAAPSSPWRAAFLRPPARLTSARYTAELGRIGFDGATVLFRTTPPPGPVLAAPDRLVDRLREFGGEGVTPGRRVRA
jgi:hypothetical protein